MGNMKIVMLGPTHPYRGGIAHYMTLLCQTLRQYHEVTFISFKRQYPNILFPGKTDKDPSKKTLRIDNVSYILDSMNPLSWIAVYRCIGELRPDKVLISWWIAFWTPQFWTIVTLLKRRFDVEIVVICHNAIEHETNSLKKLATKIFLKKADRIITHSKEDTLKLKDLMGNQIHAITAFHPTYSDIGSNLCTKEKAKERFELSGAVLLFFGFIRDYKGLDVLLEAMSFIIQCTRVTLLIVGEFWKDKQKYFNLIERFGLSAYVKVVDEYVPNESIGFYFSASDLVVQPYRSASGSGVAQLAYGFDRPVIATNVGSLSEVVKDGINGRIVEPGDAKALAHAIIESLECATLRKFSRNAVDTKKEYSWDRLAKIVAGRS